MAPAQLPDGRLGVRYAAQVSATGGTPPYRMSIVAGGLPTGVLMGPDGSILGYPGRTESYSVTIQASDASGAQLSRQYTIQITTASLILGPSSLPQGVRGQNYQASFTASGGSEPYRFTISDGSLPDGVTMSESGMLSGYPTAAGTFPLQVVVTDAAGSTQTGAYTLKVEELTLQLTPASLPLAKLGVGYGVDLKCSGGLSACTYSIVWGNLPKGVRLDASGRLSGVPEERGAFRLQILAQDPGGRTGRQSYEFSVDEAVVLPDSLPATGIGLVLEISFRVSPALDGATFRVSQGALPRGLELTPAGLLRGSPQAGGGYSFEVEARWRGAIAGERSYRLQVADELKLDTSELPAAIAGSFYNAQFAASGGQPPYQYAFVGIAPDGLNLQPNGGLAGVPKWEGSRILRVVLRDARGQSVLKEFTLLVQARSLFVETTWILIGRENVEYAGQFSASGGTPPYRWALKQGTLPLGIRLQPDGRFSGSPTEAGNFVFVVQAMDQNGRFGDRGLNLTVQSATSQWFAYPSELEFRDTGDAGQTLCVGLFTLGKDVRVSADLKLHGFSWAKLAGPPVAAPGKVCVEASDAVPAPGTWRGEVIVSASGSLPGVMRIPLTWRVEPPPDLQVHYLLQQDTLLLPDKRVPGKGAALVVNEGTRQITLTPGTGHAHWLKVPPAASEIEAGRSRALDFEVDGGGLSDGLYETILALDSSAGRLEIPVKMLTGAAMSRLVGDRRTLELTGWAGNAGGESQILTLRNEGSEDAELLIRGGDAGIPKWLTVRGVGGASVEGRMKPGETKSIEFSARTDGLVAGEYRGLVGVLGGVSPVEVAVTLRVLVPAESVVVARVPVLVLVQAEADEGETWKEVVLLGPGSRKGPVQVVNRSGREVAWLTTQTPAEAAADGSLRLRIKIAWGAVPAAAFDEAMLTVGFADGSVEEVKVVPLARSRGETASALGWARGPDSGCESGLNLHILEPADRYQATQGESLGVSTVINRCGGIVAGGSVFAAAGETVTELLPTQAGVFTGSLKLSKSGDAIVRVWAAADTGETVERCVRGKVRPEVGSRPVLERVLTGAGTTGPAVPGGRLVLQGANLTLGEFYDDTAPQSLGNVQVTLAGIALGLTYVSPERIDALVPEELPIGIATSALVLAEGSMRASRETVTAKSHPQLYTAGGAGRGLALALDVDRGVDISEKSPALPGSIVRVFLYGLDPATTCQVRLGGLDVEVLDARKAADLAGLSEVYFRVPESFRETSEASLQVRQHTLESNVVYIPIGRP
jgi:uncharacterized protein (TIGR03437 family)